MRKNQHSPAESRPLKKQDTLVVPRTVNVSTFGHRRMIKKEEQTSVRKTSAPVLGSSPNAMAGPSFNEELSVTRDIHLEKLTVKRSATSNILRPLKSAPPIATSPLGNTLYDVNRSAASRHLKSHDVVSMRIYLPHVLKKGEVENDDNVSGVQFDIESGHLVTAEYLLTLLASTYQIDENLAQETFALWMVSPLLEVQLKPHHSPHEVRGGWSTVLRRFVSTASDEEIEADEPVLFLKRNVSLSEAREIEIVTCCASSLEFLWLDARAALFSGRYPINVSDAAELAGFGLALDTNRKETPSIEYIRKNLETQLPEYLADEIRGPMVFGKSLSNARKMELVLNDWLKGQQTIVSSGVEELRRQYLAKLREAAPYYGSAFFHGTIERPSVSPFKSFKKFLKAVTSGDSSVEVRVGINRQFITVVDVSQREVMLVQKITDCAGRKIDCTNDEAQSGAEPMLLLHFPQNEEENTSPSGKRRRRDAVKINPLQVYGSQILLVNGVLTSMTELCAQAGSQTTQAQEGIEREEVRVFQQVSKTNICEALGGTVRYNMAHEITDLLHKIVIEDSDTMHVEVSTSRWRRIYRRAVGGFQQWHEWRAHESIRNNLLRRDVMKRD